jgi:hypothetical protein
MAAARHPAGAARQCDRSAVRTDGAGKGSIHTTPPGAVIGLSQFVSGAHAASISSCTHNADCDGTP